MQKEKLGKNYWLLWSGFTISTFGTYLSLIVINLFIYQITRSPLLVGIFLLLRLLPAFFMGTIAGVMADKFDRRKLIIIADLARSTLIFSVIFLRENIYPLYFIILGISICDRLYQAAMGGSIPNIAGKEKLLAANSYLATGRTIALIAGPMLGGLLISFQVYGLAFGIDSATYLFSAIMFTLISADFHSTNSTMRKSVRLWQGLKEGYGFIFAKTGLFGIILIRCLDAFGSSALNVGTPVFADSLRQFTAGLCYGLMYASFGFGEMIGSLFISRRQFIQNRPPELVIGVSILLMALFFGISFSGANIFFVMFFLCFSGISEGVTTVTYNIFMQKNPDEIRGRVVGTSETSVWTSMAVGMFLSGLMAESINISYVVFLFSAIIVIGSLAHIYVWRRRFNNSSIHPAIWKAPPARSAA